MRINYKTHPVLQKIKDGKIGTVPIYQEDMIMAHNDVISEWMREGFSFAAKDFSKNTFIVSKAFFEAAESAADKLADLYSDIVKEDIHSFSVKGAFILGDTTYLIKHEFEGGSDLQKTCLFVFDKKCIPLCFYMDDYSFRQGKCGWISNSFDLENNEDTLLKFVMTQVSVCTIIEMFRTYASVETKVVEPKQKIKDSTGKHFNETDKSITYLDSKWFTNIVRSEGFSVRGHFRLQHKKVGGIWTKELIYINTFEKSGYTSTAKKTKALRLA